MIYTCINYPIPRLVHIFYLQRFSFIFELTVLSLLKTIFSCILVGPLVIIIWDKKYNNNLCLSSCCLYTKTTPERIKKDEA